MRSIFMSFLLLYVAACLVPPRGVAEENGQDLKGLVEMSLEDLLDMKVVSAARHEQRIIESPKSISIVTAEEIRKKNYRTTPEALNELVGVLVQETNYGGGSPIIRGLVGNQILILIDGIRLNNAIFRLGPNQYLNTIDVNQIERIEVVRGPGSVLHGSDALGGLINIITKSRRDEGKDFDFGARFYSRYASADDGRTGRMEFFGNVKRVGITGGFSYKQFGNLRAGDGVGLQPFTGYDEWDLDLKMDGRFSKRQSVSVGLQLVNQSNVPRTDRLASGSDLKRQWNPETRDLLYVQYELKEASSFINAVRASFSYQNQSEDLERITSAEPDIQQEYHDEVRSTGYMLQLHSPVGERHLFTYGAEYYADDVRSWRVDVDLTCGTQADKEGTFADGSTYQSLATFVQDEIKVTEPLSANLGLRYSWFEARAAVDDPATGTVTVHSHPTALTGCARALYELTENFVAALGVGQGFRAPNIDDLTILGSFGSGFEVPNTDLKPEQSLNYEIGLKAQHRKFSGSFSYFLSNYEDLIERDGGMFLSLAYLDNNDNGIQDEGEEDVFQRKNIGKARIQGLEVEAQILVSGAWTVLGNVAWIRGDDLIEGEPLRRIPPVKGMLGCEWRLRRNLWVEYYNMFATKQDRLAPGDIDDPRIPVGGTPGFVTFNLRGGIDFSNWGNVTVALENITNEVYRLHGSGIDCPGVNLVIGYELSL
jgi:hemoglobin/transferrin/lactoferrin receptor protein